MRTPRKAKEVGYKLPSIKDIPAQCLKDLKTYLKNVSYELELEADCLTVNLDPKQHLEAMREHSAYAINGMKEAQGRIDTLVAYLEEYVLPGKH